MLVNVKGCCPLFLRDGDRNRVVDKIQGIIETFDENDPIVSRKVFVHRREGREKRNWVKKLEAQFREEEEDAVSANSTRLGIVIPSFHPFAGRLGSLIGSVQNPEDFFPSLGKNSKNWSGLIHFCREEARFFKSHP